MQTQIYYIYYNNHQHGPYVLEQIRGMWNSGTITADTLFWQEGMTDWQEIKHLMLANRPSIPTISLKPNITKPLYKNGSDSFHATMPLMIKLAIKAIGGLGWKLDSVNESVGLVSFQTGMSWGSWSGVSCSLNIEEVTENHFRVFGAGKQNVRGAQLVALDFGEANGKAQKAIHKMKELAI